MSANTYSNLNGGVGPIALDTSSDGAYLGASAADRKIFNRTADYTQQANYAGHIQVVTLGTTVTCTLPNNLPTGWFVDVVQGGAGVVSFVPASGATMVNRQNFTKTAGANAVVRLFVVANADGASAKYVLSGDGQV